jgi:excisionase family DNA binding protein
METQKQFYTVSEIATILGITRNGIYGYVRKGLIPHVRLGDRVLIPKSFVDGLLDSVNE